jgi:DNA-binding NarL/FixJ family response regulator
VRLILVDDSTLFRSGLAGLLTGAGHKVVAELADAENLATSVGDLAPDVVVLDIRMPPTWTTEGLRAAVDLRADHPGVGVLVLSQYVESAHAERLLREAPSGMGYLLKDRVGHLTQLTSALDQIAAGGTVIDPEVVGILLDHKRRTGRLARLTERELEVLRSIAEGRSNAAVSQELHLSPRTVETHVSNIFSKLDIGGTPAEHRRVLAVIAYLRG